MKKFNALLGTLLALGSLDSASTGRPLPGLGPKRKKTEQQKQKRDQRKRRKKSRGW